MYPSPQAGYTRAILSLSLNLQRLAKWEETIYAGRLWQKELAVVISEGKRGTWMSRFAY